MTETGPRPVVISLCDHSGNWSKPFMDNGYEVVTVDIKETPHKHPNRTHIVSDVRLWKFDERLKGRVVGVLAAPPCTDFSLSCTRLWKEKDADGRTAASLSIVDACLRVAANYKPRWWALENPVGRLSYWLGEPTFRFDPCDFARRHLSREDEGRLDALRNTDWSQPGMQLAEDDVKFIWDTNAYTKKTQLWGDFTPPMKNRLPPVKACKDGSLLLLLGGKSEKTKEARSVTPWKFAEAFFWANHSA